MNQIHGQEIHTRNLQYVIFCLELLTKNADPDKYGCSS